MRPFVEPLLNVPYPEDKVFNSAQQLFNELEKMGKILPDSDKTSVRIVLNAEKMVIKEAQRTFIYLTLYGYHTDLIVCNRLLPHEVGDSYFRSWKESQIKYRKLGRVHTSNQFVL